VKRFFITLVVSFGIVLIILRFVGQQSILDFRLLINPDLAETERDIEMFRHALSSALAYVGIPLFFLSLIMMTDANRALISMGFAVRSIIPRYREKYSDYHEYQEKKRREGGVGMFGISSFIISIGYIVWLLIVWQYPS